MTDETAEVDTRPLTDQPCLNCGDPTPGNYCRHCGQRKAEHRASMKVLLRETLQDQFSLTSELPRTFKALLFRPGRLTTEYSRGRIATYIPPFRLYLFTSIIFFLTLSLVSSSRSPFGKRSGGVVQFDVDGAPSNTQSGAGGNGAMRAAPLGDSAGVRDAAAERARLAMRDSIRRNAEIRMDSVLAERRAERQVARVALDSIASSGARGWMKAKWLHAFYGLTDRIEEKIAALNDDPEELSQRINDFMLQRAPTVIFLLLPVFALLLKLFYWRSGRYYAEHFCFSLHIHAFAFLLFTLIVLLPKGGDWIIFTRVLLGWLAVYGLIAVKRVYGQRWAITTVKYVLLGATYTFVLATALLAELVVALLML